MRKAKKIKILFALSLTLVAFVLWLPSCANDEAEDEADVNIAVTISPQKEMVERIGGEYVSVLLLVPPGESPHTYDPSPSLFVSLESTDIYTKMGSGVEFEIEWTDKLIDINPQMLVVDCSKGVELLYSGEVEEGVYDPHIWLSPVNAVTIAENIYEALSSFDEEHTDYYLENFNAYKSELLELDADIKALMGEGVKSLLWFITLRLLILQQNMVWRCLPLSKKGKSLPR